MHYLLLCHTLGQFCPAKNGLIYSIGAERGVGGGKKGWVSLTEISKGTTVPSQAIAYIAYDFKEHVYNEFFRIYVYLVSGAQHSSIVTGPIKVESAVRSVNI